MRQAAPRRHAPLRAVSRTSACPWSCVCVCFLHFGRNHHYLPHCSVGEVKRYLPNDNLSMDNITFLQPSKAKRNTPIAKHYACKTYHVSTLALPEQSRANPIARHYVDKADYFMTSAFRKPSKANPIARHFAYERQELFTRKAVPP